MPSGSGWRASPSLPTPPGSGSLRSSFEYTETDDQLRCIQEIKRDMEQSPVPMDRLLCGDVGYGKTEVAFRAVMKCVLDGKQAAVLVPTTVLARQHYLTALRRFAKYPVSIDVVSRFRTPAQARTSSGAPRRGRWTCSSAPTACSTGTCASRIWACWWWTRSSALACTHKEKLKELSRQVDVLTLSATPIPRTLNMALRGIRDMSTLEEPPATASRCRPTCWSTTGRRWGRHAPGAGAGGQVYYLHNRVDTIDRTAAASRPCWGRMCGGGGPRQDGPRRPSTR